MANGNQRRQFPWGAVFDRSLLVTVAVAAVIMARENAAQSARLEQRVMSHLETHPDFGLSQRIDRLQMQLDRQAEQIRALELL